ncbi:putative S-layer homology domain protein [Peptoniphilus sp. ING2-D1G]|nr:putative S-layer homology domain protein [Peptoniphilus sp. ING2-D1G]
MKKIYKILFITLVFLILPKGIYAKSFTDLKSDGEYGWAYNAVDSLSEKNIFGGYPDGTFKPYRAVSFLEIMQVIKNIKNPSPDELKAAENTYYSTANIYHVPSWAIEAVCYNLAINTITERTLEAAERGGFLRDTNTVFPNRNSVTVYFGRAFNLPQGDMENLRHEDLDKIPQMTKEYLTGLIEAGVYAATGSDGYFNGSKYIRRSEVAIVADNYLNYLNGNSTPVETGNLIGVKTVKGKLSAVSLNGSNSTVTIDGKDYNVDINSVQIAMKDGQRVDNILNLINHDVEGYIEFDAVKRLKSLENLGEERYANRIEFSARVIKRDDFSGGYDIQVLVSDNPLITAGTLFTISSDMFLNTGDLIKVKANIVDRELEDMRIEKL